MRITDKTKYKSIASMEKYFSKRTINDLKQAAENKYGGMYDLPFATFYACSNGDFSNLGNTDNPTVLQVYWCKRFHQFEKEFAEHMKKATLMQNNDELRAAEGALKISWGEAVLVFVQQFFGLGSFKDAEKITTGEILIAKRAQYNRDLFQRNMAKIQVNKFKKK